MHVIVSAKKVFYYELSLFPEEFFNCLINPFCPITASIPNVRNNVNVQYEPPEDKCQVLVLVEFD